MTTIKPLEGRTVHQIQSGQVIVDLCSVVKELVENSLDAGATAIDVRFRNNGLDAIEVQDNGIGISSENYETVALKHYTSKLTNYDDLTTLQTFGFRGEALSSLCALSNFHIITAKGEDAPKGTRLDFEISGKLKSTQVVASQKGTTVAVESLFQNLPVRRRELEKNIKREYGKVLGVLQAYACISTEVKLSVSNVMAKGKKSIVFATKSNPTTRENIANVFGAKVLPALISMDLRFEMRDSGKPSLQDPGIETRPENQQVHVAGHVSRPVFGDGRQTPDRQTFFVNARPCGLPQVAKIFNEVYKSFNVSQSPFIFANILLDTNAYDVNVSPDKRTILLHDQGTLLENLRTSLIDLFEKQDQTVPQIQRPIQKLPLFKQSSVQRNSSVAESSEGTNDEPRTAEDEDEGDGDRSSLVGASDPLARGVRRNLIEDFAGRDTRERVKESIPTIGVSNGSEPLSKDKQRLVRRLGNDSNSVQALDEYEDTQDIVASNTSRDDRSIPVLDFNKRLTELQGITGSRITNSPSFEDEEIEESIRSITGTPDKPSPGVVQNAFDRMRPQRTPTQTATITIGDKTTTSVLGPTVSKRQKVIPSPRTLVAPTSVASQRFSSSLRSFAAPVTQLETPSGSRPSISPTIEYEEVGETSSQRSESRSSGSDRSDGEQKGQRQPGRLGKKSEEDDSDDEEQERRSTADQSDEDYVDDVEKKAREDAKVVALIKQAEEAASVPSQDNIRRANKLLKGGRPKESTTQLIQFMDQSIERIDQQLDTLSKHLQDSCQNKATPEPLPEPEVESPEERLSLKVSKEDFSRMHIIGQFNLGFILAVRPSHSPSTSDELFIIDQHASDEKYNFERLQAMTTVQNQRLVHPHLLDLTAIEEEIILENNTALTCNGFLVDIDTSGDSPVGQRCKLISLPMSREVTFDTTDLEELIALLAESAPSHSTVPRPTRVRKMLAMRACRSSVMIGKSLSLRQMERLVRQMGEIDKPWNCPHGRPTMRHVLGLGAWEGWEEGDGVVGLGGDGDEGEEKEVDWRGWMRGISGEDDAGGEEGDEEDGWAMATQQGAEEEGGDYDEEEEDESHDERGGSDDEAREEDEGEGDEDEQGEDEEEAAPSKLNLLGRFGSRG